MMSPTEASIALAWAFTLYGFALWLWSWTKVKSPILRLRYQDCGVVLVFSSTLALYALRARELNFLDWILVFLGPLFIGTALWRLFRTQGLVKN